VNKSNIYLFTVNNPQQAEAAEGVAVQQTHEIVSVLPVGDGAVGSEDVLPQSAPSPLEVLSLAKSILTETMVRSIQAIYLFKLAGNDGGMFFLDLKNGESCTLINIFILNTFKFVSNRYE